MKKSFSFAILIAIITVFAACNKNNETLKVGPGITIMTDSVVCVSAEPITAPRYGCNGKVLTHPKFLGMDYTNTVVIPPKEKNIPDSLLRAKGYEYTGSTSATSIKPMPASGFESDKKKGGVVESSVFPWPVDIWKALAIILLTIALILFGIWLLWHLARLLWDNKPGNTQNVNTSSKSPQSPDSAVVLSDADREKIVAETKDAVVKEFEEVESDRLYYQHVESITKILQSTGGRVDNTIGNCIYTISIPHQKTKKQKDGEESKKE